MKTAITSILIWVILWAFAGALSAEPPITDAIKDWKTVRVSIEVIGGDVDFPTPFVLLQRMDAERVVLSTGQWALFEDFLPVARAIITEGRAQMIVDRALGFYAQAQKEVSEQARVDALPRAERETAYWKAGGYGIAATYIRIEILSAGRSYHYQDDFSDHTSTREAFSDFITEQNPESR